MSETISRRAFAKEMGVTDRAVRKAIERGRLTPEADGKLDPVKAREQWEETATIPAPDGHISLAEAERRKQVALATKHELQLAQMRGELLDRRTVEKEQFEVSRRFRDGLLGWPARIAAEMAVELSVDPALLSSTLERYVREHLIRQSDELRRSVNEPTLEDGGA